MNCLEDSIKHWQRLLALVLAKDHEGLDKEGWGREQCACCDEFFFYNCKGCPVSEYTGRISCMSTPYSEAAYYLEDFTYDNANVVQCKIAVENELEFLRSLK